MVDPVLAAELAFRRPHTLHTPPYAAPAASMTRCVGKRKASGNAAPPNSKRRRRSSSLPETSTSSQNRQLTKHTVLSAPDGDGYFFYAPSEFTRVAYLASGGFGAVCSALRFGEEVVVKKIHCADAVFAESALRELHTAAWFTAAAEKAGGTPCAGIVKLRDCWVHDAEGGETFLYLVFDKYDMTLEGLVEKRGRLTGPRWRDFARMLVEAVHAMHSVSSFHRDLKPENVVLSANLSRLAIIDLGSVRSNELSVLRPFTPIPNVTTEGYRAPEVHDAHFPAAEYDDPIDIFALGCVLAYARLGKHIFPDDADLQEWAALGSAGAAKFIKKLFKNLKLSRVDAALLHGMLERDPEKRLTARGALELLKIDPSAHALQGPYEEPDYTPTGRPGSQAKILDSLRALVREYHRTPHA